MESSTADLLLSEAEIRKVCGGYVQPAKQLAELQRQGFYRARRARTGEVILERAHYDAICAGGRQPANEPRARPRVRA